MLHEKVTTHWLNSVRRSKAAPKILVAMAYGRVLEPNNHVWALGAARMEEWVHSIQLIYNKKFREQANILYGL